MKQIIVEIVKRITNLLETKEQVIIAIDGRCASGKTTIALELKQLLQCNVFHMDDFFLPFHLRTEQRLRLPGENVDYERFLYEVMIPLQKKEIVSYLPYHCGLKTWKEKIEVSPCAVNIIEGSYSQHVRLREYYDCTIFLTVDKDTQLKRIAARREKNDVSMFVEKWIPLEEQYFKVFQIEENSDLKYDNSSFVPRQ